MSCGLLLLALLAASQANAVDSVVYVVSPTSRLEVKTGKGGLLGFAGHDHVIRARSFSGRIVYYPTAPDSSRVAITVVTESLEVLTPPDTAEIRKVTAAMREDVLDVANHPEIRFSGRAVALESDTLRLHAAVTIRGRTRELPLAVRVHIGPDTLRAAATFRVKQTDFGIRPYRGGPAGLVRVGDRVTFTIEIVAARERAPAPPAPPAP